MDDKIPWTHKGLKPLVRRGVIKLGYPSYIREPLSVCLKVTAYSWDPDRSDSVMAVSTPRQASRISDRTKTVSTTTAIAVVRRDNSNTLPTP